MREILLIINAGSSSLKFQIYEIDAKELKSVAYGGQVSGIGGEHPRFFVHDRNKAPLHTRELPLSGAHNLDAAQHYLTDWLETEIAHAPRGVGHRIVHGGPRLIDSVLLDDEVLEYLDTLVPLAPLHQRNNLAPVRVIRERWPETPQVACFDTAFHRNHEEIVQRFALPQSYYDKGVRRYGFHGLSYAYISAYLESKLPKVSKGRVIAAHLGSGASACAMLKGKSVESTMGFTALDGLPMSTRPGRLDPGVVLWMLQRGMTENEIQHLLYHESGLKGLSGVSGDVRQLVASGDPGAKLALDYFAYRTAESIAGLCVSIKGIDALVFTAGVGENSAIVRSSICDHLSWMGVKLDAALNKKNATHISSMHSPIQVYVVPTNEELIIARQTLEKLNALQQ